MCSRAYSEVLGLSVALAWVKREHRTPGSRLTVRGQHGLWPAEVALLPLYNAPDSKARVAQDYDQAVKAFAAGDTPTALRLLGHALSLDPTFADGYEVLGVILGRSGAYHEAIDFFKRLEEVAPAEPLVHTNLSLYYMKLGDTETAELHRALAVQKSLQGGDTSRDATELAREALESRQADARRKRAMFEQVLAFDPDDDIALLGAGRALSVLEEWPEAEATLLRAVQANARSSVSWLALGRAQEHLGKVVDASVTYERGIAVASKRGELVPLKEMQNRRLLLVGSGSDRSD
ncbi:MAG: Flp pilus assembly protein TadD [Kiritimatiellia bacterium]